MRLSVTIVLPLLMLAGFARAGEPSFTMEEPVEGGVYRDLSSASGFANRGDLVGDWRLAFGLRRVAPAPAWWHWRDRVWGPVENYGTLTNPVRWELHLPFLDTGDYESTAYVVERAGVRRVVRFSIDRLPPIFVVTEPAAGTTYAPGVELRASGTWGDAGKAGFAGATLRLFRYAEGTSPVATWNWTEKRWQTGDGSALTTPVLLLPGGFWTWTLPRLESGRYGVQTSATDRVGNVRFNDTREFTVQDIVAPTLTVQRPLDGGTYANLGEARGTAADTGGAVARVELRLARDRDGSREYRRWSDGAWLAGSSAGLVANATGTTTWSRPMPSLPDGWYELEVSAIDTAGNRGPTFPLGVSFIIDRTAPSSAFSAPAAGSEFPEGIAIELTGWTQDASPATTSLRLARAGRGLPRWWDWQQRRWTLAWWRRGVALPLGGQGSWAATTPTLPAGTYRASAEAVDLAGNRTTATVRFALAPTAND